MLKSWQFWILTAIGAVALALAGTNMVLSQGNGQLQGEFNTRGQYLQETVALQNLYREIVQALADRAIRTKDEQIRDLLAAEGFSVNINPPAQGGQGGKP